MATTPNKLSKFWQELKRRNVARVITVYAASAFVILQLFDIISEPFGFPSWTVKFVFVILAVGLVVAITISWIYDIHPEGGVIKTESSREVELEDIPKSSETWKIASYISFAVIIAMIALNILTRKKVIGLDESMAKTIAVLPFHNYSGNPEQDYMCEGLTDEIIGNLYKVKSFDKVVSLTSVLNYKDPERNMPKIAEELSVNYILEGTYKKMGDRLKITAQLIEPRSDKHIWLQDYELPYNEIPGIPGEIAFQIADHLKAFITGEEQKNISRMPTENIEAYEIMQRAIHLFNIYLISASEEIINLSREAITIDQNYADAHAMIGLVTVMKGAYFGDTEMKSVAWDATMHLNTALELDYSNVRALTGLAILNHFLQWDFIKAEEAYLKAINYKQGEPVLNAWYAMFLLQMKRVEDYHQFIVKIDFRIREHIGKSYFLAGEHQKAAEIAIIDEEFDFPTDYTGKAELFNWLGDYKSAIDISEYAILEESPERNYPRFQTNLAIAYYKSGAVKQAKSIIDKLKLRSKTSVSGSPNFFLGIYYCWTEECDSAFYWLENAYDNHSAEMPWLKVDPAFRILKDDPRYWDLYERTGHKAYDEYMDSRKDY